MAARASPATGRPKPCWRCWRGRAGRMAQGRFTIQSWAAANRVGRARDRCRPDERIDHRRRCRGREVGDSSAGGPASRPATDRGAPRRGIRRYAQTVGPRHLAAARRRGDTGGERRRIPSRCRGRLDLGGRTDHRRRPRPSPRPGGRCGDRRRHRGRRTARRARQHGHSRVARRRGPVARHRVRDARDRLRTT